MILLGRKKRYSALKVTKLLVTYILEVLRAEDGLENRAMNNYRLGRIDVTPYNRIRSVKGQPGVRLNRSILR